MKNTQI